MAEVYYGTGISSLLSELYNKAFIDQLKDHIEYFKLIKKKPLVVVIEKK